MDIHDHGAGLALPLVRIIGRQVALARTFLLGELSVELLQELERVACLQATIVRLLVHSRDPLAIVKRRERALDALALARYRLTKSLRRRVRRWSFARAIFRIARAHTVQCRRTDWLERRSPILIIGRRRSGFTLALDTVEKPDHDQCARERPLQYPASLKKARSQDVWAFCRDDLTPLVDDYEDRARILPDRTGGPERIGRDDFAAG